MMIRKEYQACISLRNHRTTEVSRLVSDVTRLGSIMGGLISATMAQVALRRKKEEEGEESNIRSGKRVIIPSQGVGSYNKEFYRFAGYDKSRQRMYVRQEAKAQQKKFFDKMFGRRAWGYGISSAYFLLDSGGYLGTWGEPTEGYY